MPLIRLNVILLVEELPWKTCPVLFVTLVYHVVPDGRPDSVNVTAYVAKVNVTDTDCGLPLTVTEPEDEEGL